MSGLTETVRRTRTAAARDEFDRRVRAQADRLHRAFAEGDFRNDEYAIGLELEGYATDTEGRLAPVPASIIGDVCEMELGVHNAELNTPVTAFDATGTRTQAEAVATRVDAIRAAFADHGLEFVTDGMWVVPPPEGTEAYLTAASEHDETAIVTNMRDDPRYHALNDDIMAHGPIEVDVPGFTGTFSTILPESFATSMQVHLQVPTDEYAHYHNLAIRTTGPVLALAANAPFLPVDLYGPDGEADPGAVLDEGYHELRVPVFESMNVRTPGKVRLPDDIDDPAGSLDCLVADRRCAPFLREWTRDGPRETFLDRYWELIHKQSTCWRWVRSVLAEGSIRLEYRPLAAQPTAADVVGFQLLVTGLLHGLAVTDHPLCELPWADAHDAFYAAVRDGLGADPAWVTRDGDRTSDTEVVYEEVFDLARRGLRERGLDDDRIDELLRPVEGRWLARTAPSDWKRTQVRTRLDAGDSLRDAITGMQREYIERASTDQPFVDWLV